MRLARVKEKGGVSAIKPEPSKAEGTAKNEIPISKFETNHDSNSKSENRNPKQYQKSNDQNFKLLVNCFEHLYFVIII